MLAGLSDSGIGGSVASRTRATAASKPSGVPSSRFGVTPMSWLSGLLSTSATVRTAATRVARGIAELAVGLSRPIPSSLNGPISCLRRYSAARVSLHDEQVCQALDVTINDVALAALTESYRALLVRRGEQPLPDSVRTLVPVSTRSTDAFDQTDNRVSLMLPYLPVEEQNPVQRLRMVHSRLARSKTTRQRQAGNTVVSVAGRIPFALTAWGCGC